MESLAGALGIAYLTPTAEAGRFVRRPGDGMRGYALVNGDEERISLSLWLENGRPLSDRTGRDGFYYEAWLGDLSVGPFNADSTGHGCLTTTLGLTTARPVWPTGAPPALIAIADQFKDGLPAALPMRVTVEPFGGTPAGGVPVLTGSITWLGATPPLGAGESVAEALSLSGAPELPVEADPVVGVGAQAAPLNEVVRAEAEAEISRPEVTAAESARSEMTAAESARPKVAPPAEPPRAEVATPESTGLSAADDPAVKAVPAEPAPTPEREAQLAALLEQNLIITRRPLIRPVEPESTPLNATFKVKSVHPLAPRVHASGTLDGERGALTIQVRSLPSPSALGKNEETGRPWSAYRAWLTHSTTGAAQVVGLLGRGSVDQWRLEVPEGLPLHRFDTLLVCLDDRNNAEPKPTPIVLQGSILA